MLTQWLLGASLSEIAITGISVFAALAFLAAFTLQSKLDQVEAQTPVLQLGDPQQFNNEIVDVTPAILWRIPVTNTVHYTKAENVEVTLQSANIPQLTMLPISLHRMHDNPTSGQPFQRRWDIRHEDVFLFDFLAQDKANPDIFYLFRSDGDRREQEGPDWTLNPDEGRALYDMAIGNGCQFTVRATPDPPARGQE